MSSKRPILYDAMPDHNFLWSPRVPFKQLNRFSREVSDRKNWTLQVSGESGSGKTWLLRIFLFAGLEDTWWRVVCGESGNLVDQLIHSILTRYPGWKTLDGISDEMINVLRYFGTESIRKLFAVDKSSREFEGLVADDDIYETVIKLLVNTLDHQTGSINLWIEDLSSADRQDLIFLEFLKSECIKTDLPLHLVITTTKNRKPKAVSDCIRLLSPDFNLILKSWNEDDLVLFLHHNYGITMNQSNRDFAAGFCRNVGGLPFRVTQTMAFLQERKVLVEKKNHGWGVRSWRQLQWPTRLEEVLTKRLERVAEHPVTWRVLTAVSQLPDMNDSREIEQALGLSPEELQKQQYLLYCKGFLDREYRFRQPVIRDIVLQMLSEKDTRTIAGELFRALQESDRSLYVSEES